MKKVSRIFLGVDGGQSSTTAVIGDESGRVLASGVSGPCNHVGTAEGHEKFVGAMNGCLAAACREAGLEPAGARFASACLGFSGGPADKLSLVERMISAEKLLVTTDAAIALAGATGGQPGLITIAGTGSVAFGRNRRGQTARAGGWGYVFGDEGSAFDIVRRALRAALRSEEGWGTPTALRAHLLETAGGDSVNDLLHRFYTSDFPRDRIASFAPLVDRAAAGGDTVAQAILAEAAHELAGLALAVRERLFLPGEAVRAAYTGGVFRSAIVRESFQRRIESEPARYPPAIGALIEAYRAVDLNPTLMLRSGI